MNKNTILITGGTGSLGQNLVKHCLNKDYEKIVILSRDEHKQVEMERRIADKRVRFFLGDIRDKERLYRAFESVKVVIHCAALKHVPKLEYDPFEAVKTNVIGTQNIIDASIHNGVKKVLGIGSDKAVNPINLYGATKLVADKLFMAASAYATATGTKFSVIRFGNFYGSRGSVVPLFENCENNVLPITDKKMTRFFISFDRACERIFKALEIMRGGEIFAPKMQAMKITDLARTIRSNATFEEIGIRPGEKLSEDLILNVDAKRTYEHENFFITYPNGYKRQGKKVSPDFTYNSNDCLGTLGEIA